MGEEVKMSEYEPNGEEDNGDYEERVHEWEMGLPSADDLTPLSQPLIPPELASAFSISPEPCRTLIDVNRESRNTLSSLRGGGVGVVVVVGGGGGVSSHALSSSSNNFKSFADDRNRRDDPIIVEEEEDDYNHNHHNNNNSNRDRGEGSESRKSRKLDSMSHEETDSVDDQSARTLKRPRLVWTPQLHKRFVDVVAYLGFKNAVPKTIMQLMNVEGLTRENVASHLQKYRLYLKRMQGGEGPSSSDQLFASTPVPHSLHETSGGGGGMQVMQLPAAVYGYHHRHHGFEANSSYKFYPHRVAPNENK